MTVTPRPARTGPGTGFAPPPATAGMTGRAPAPARAAPGGNQTALRLTHVASQSPASGVTTSSAPPSPIETDAARQAAADLQAARDKIVALEAANADLVTQNGRLKRGLDARSERLNSQEELRLLEANQLETRFARALEDADKAHERARAEEVAKVEGMYKQAMAEAVRAKEKELVDLFIADLGAIETAAASASGLVETQEERGSLVKKMNKATSSAQTACQKPKDFDANQFELKRKIKVAEGARKKARWQELVAGV